VVKIFSGWTNKGGSTVALINLTNALNGRGVDTTFYGRQDWHLDKCKSSLLEGDYPINTDDSVIFHFLQLPQRPNAKKVLLTCHEKWWFMVGNIQQYWDELIFLHEEHRKYHNTYRGEYDLIPNIKESFEKKDKSDLNEVAGIVGAIEDRKQTHLSIQRALRDGCKKIYLFGHINDERYYNGLIKPLLGERIEHYGFTEDKQSMYDMVGRVYHSSKGEVACLVKDECHLTGTQFYGNEETLHEVSDLTNDEIVDKWIKVLDI